MHCPYCSLASRQSDGQVFCSKHMSDFEQLETGIFYIKGKDIDSGEHLSRFALRFIVKGKMDFRIDGRDFRFHREGLINFNSRSSYRLIIPAQQHDTVQIGIAYKPSFLRSFAAVNALSWNSLLDDPGREMEMKESASSFIPFTPTWCILQAELFSLVEPAGNIEPVSRDRLAVSILEYYMQQNTGRDACAGQLSGFKRMATRNELLRRLMIAKDFILTSDSAALNVAEVARVACLSEYHFIRSYKAAYRKSPYQDIMQRKMQEARTLLLHSQKPITDIASAAGYQSRSAFARHFKAYFKRTPSQVRSGL